ncbi:heme-dependent oxidative N-demethylase family protein [Nocardioides sp.]|uniref:heme-dependent oxidative N-demethylase family protein n=1 Tax=Nocardioides sp. TaxID=35761 RepID=UPI0039E442A0
MTTTREPRTDFSTIAPLDTASVRAYLGQPIDHMAGLPWPFPDGYSAFRYSVNVDQARVPRQTLAGEWGRHIVDLGGAEYPLIMAERRAVLDADPARVKVLPGMEVACWDLLLYYVRDLSLSYPELMHLEENVEGRADAFRWRNDLLGTDQSFVLGEESTLPCGPLEFLAREVPDDLLMVRERDGKLHFDAGAVTFAAAWSVSFDVGMDMYEIHGPVPRMTGSGMTARAEQFLKRLPADQVFRRVNWNIAASPTRKFDIALESLPDWGGDMDQARAAGEAIENCQFRIELEHFIRLPMSGAVTFNIRTFMASLAEVRAYPAYAGQLADILAELPEDLATYKGFVDLIPEMVAYLRDSDVAPPSLD